MLRSHMAWFSMSGEIPLPPGPVPGNSLFAGMLMFFVLRHEVPSPKEGRFVPLFLGALGYAALALAIESL